MSIMPSEVVEVYVFGTMKFNLHKGVSINYNIGSGRSKNAWALWR